MIFRSKARKSSSWEKQTQLDSLTKSLVCKFYFKLLNAVLKSPVKIAKFRLLGVAQWGGNVLHLSEDSSPEILPTPLSRPRAHDDQEILHLTPQSQSQVSYHKLRATSELRIETRNDS